MLSTSLVMFIKTVIAIVYALNVILVAHLMVVEAVLALIAVSFARLLSSRTVTALEVIVRSEIYAWIVGLVVFCTAR